MSLHHPRLCVAVGISVGHGIYQQLPTVVHEVFQLRCSALSAIDFVISYDFAVRIGGVQANDKAL